MDSCGAILGHSYPMCLKKTLSHITNVSEVSLPPSLSLLSLCPFVSVSCFLTELLTLKSVIGQIQWLDGR